MPSAFQRVFRPDPPLCPNSWNPVRTWITPFYAFAYPSSTAGVRSVPRVASELALPPRASRRGLEDHQTGNTHRGDDPTPKHLGVIRQHSCRSLAVVGTEKNVHHASPQLLVEMIQYCFPPSSQSSKLIPLCRSRSPHHISSEHPTEIFFIPLC